METIPYISMAICFGLLEVAPADTSILDLNSRLVTRCMNSRAIIPCGEIRSCSQRIALLFSDSSRTTLVYGLFIVILLGTYDLPLSIYIVTRPTSRSPERTGIWRWKARDLIVLFFFICRHMDSGLMMQFANLAGLDKLRVPSEVTAMCPGNRQS